MYIVPYFNNRRETSKNDARYPIVYAAKSSLDPDGPALALSDAVSKRKGRYKSGRCRTVRLQLAALAL